MNTTNTQDPSTATKALARTLQHLANSQDEEVADAMTRAADRLFDLATLQPATAQPQGVVWLVMDEKLRRVHYASRSRESAEKWLSFHRDNQARGEVYIGPIASTIGSSFDAHDMATAAADGFRDGVASTQASEPSTEVAIQEALESELLESKLEEMMFENDPLPERDTTKPTEQQGLFRKFIVNRTDGSDAPGGKHHGCEYFVLDVDHDDHAKAALAAYAASVAATHPKLAADMRERYDLPSQTAAPARAVEPLTEAIAAEREACAQLVESTKEWRGKGWVSTLSPETQAAIVAAIRARAHGITATPPTAKAGKDGA